MTMPPMESFVNTSTLRVYELVSSRSTHAHCNYSNSGDSSVTFNNDQKFWPIETASYAILGLVGIKSYDFTSSYERDIC